MRFLAVVLKIKSNKIQILTRISVEINKNRKRKIIYGSILQLSFKNILSFKNGDCLQSSPVYICKVDTLNIIEKYANFVGAIALSYPPPPPFFIDDSGAEFHAD